MGGIFVFGLRCRDPSFCVDHQVYYRLILYRVDAENGLTALPSYAAP